MVHEMDEQSHCDTNYICLSECQGSGGYIKEIFFLSKLSKPVAYRRHG